MVLEFKNLFQNKVTIQIVNIHELMKQGGLVLNYHLYLSYDYSIGFTENRN
jgi:hypothetical protein